MHDGDGSDPKRAASWVSANGYSSEQVSVQYMAAIFFIFTTFSTVGYGDIAPMNELEQARPRCCLPLPAPCLPPVYP